MDRVINGLCMSDISKIAIIGCGNMGGAIIGGLVKSGIVMPSNIIACDTNEQLRTSLRDKFGVRVTSNASEAVLEASVCIIAVKPNLVSAVAADISVTCGSSLKGRVIISIAGGVTLRTISECFVANGNGVHFVRVMPNLPAAIGCGCTAIFSESREGISVAKQIFETVGIVVEVPKESDLNAVTGLSGSGPGFVFLMIEAMQQGGIISGLSPSVALSLATQTFIGAAKMLQETNEHPAVLRDKVTTPAGTTITGIACMETAGVRAGIVEGVIAATQRSQEMSEIYN